MDAFRPGHRIYWLSFPVPAPTALDAVGRSVRAGWDEAAVAVGLPRSPIGPDEAGRYARRAQAVVSLVPRPFAPAPATPAQLVWLHHHQLYRGLSADAPLPPAAETVEQALVAKGASCMPAPVLDEGGLPDEPLGTAGQVRARVGAVHRRWLKVADEVSAASTGAAAYQVPLVVRDTPSAGGLFPGSEILGRLDECGVDADWAVRVTVRRSGKVAARNSRALRNLNEQFDQRSAEVSVGATALDRTAALLTEYAAVLDADKAVHPDPGLRPGGPTLPLGVASDQGQCPRQQRQPDPDAAQHQHDQQPHQRQRLEQAVADEQQAADQGGETAGQLRPGSGHRPRAHLC